jgi:AcrR family transcriptional regulator
VRRDAAINRERLVRAAEEVFAERGPAATLADVANAAAVGPATLYRRFANRDALVQVVLSDFFRHLIDVTVIAEQSPPEAGLDVFLRTVGVELAANAGLSAPVWAQLAPEALVEELRRRSTELLRRAQRAGAARADVTPDDITAAVWALRGATWRRSCGVSGVRRVDDYSAQLFSTKPEMCGLSRRARRRGRWPDTRRQRDCRCFAP